MSSGPEDNFALSPVADLTNPVRLSRARATSHNRIRVDFSGLVDNNAALADRRNWRLWSFRNGEFQPPTVLGVEVPNSAGSQASHIILLTSEMNNGAIYCVTVNSSSLVFGLNMFVAAEMNDTVLALDSWELVG